MVVGHAGISGAATLGLLFDGGRPSCADGCLWLHQVWHPPRYDYDSGLRVFRFVVSAGPRFRCCLVSAGSKSPSEDAGSGDRGSVAAPIRGRTGVYVAVLGLT